jgi:hypothetical protein
MAMSSSASLPSAAVGRGGLFRPLADLRSLWRRFLSQAFNPYRPELHYMRGPGPAWRAKYGHEAAFRLSRPEL